MRTTATNAMTMEVWANTAFDAVDVVVGTICDATDYVLGVETADTACLVRPSASLVVVRPSTSPEGIVPSIREPFIIPTTFMVDPITIHVVRCTLFDTLGCLTAPAASALLTRDAPERMPALPSELLTVAWFARATLAPATMILPPAAAICVPLPRRISARPCTPDKRKARSSRRWNRAPRKGPKPANSWVQFAVTRGDCWSLHHAVFCNMPRRAPSARALSTSEIQAIEGRAAMVEANAALWENAKRILAEAEVPPESRIPKPETRNPKPETRSPRPKTRNPKPKTRNQQPATSKPNPES